MKLAMVLGGWKRGNKLHSFHLPLSDYSTFLLTNNGINSIILVIISDEVVLPIEAKDEQHNQNLPSYARQYKPLSLDTIEGRTTRSIALLTTNSCSTSIKQTLHSPEFVYQPIDLHHPLNKSCCFDYISFAIREVYPFPDNIHSIFLIARHRTVNQWYEIPFKYQAPFLFDGYMVSSIEETNLITTVAAPIKPIQCLNNERSTYGARKRDI